MYDLLSRVRYSEINRDKTLDLSSIINYFQDCSTFQSEDAGVGIGYLEARHRLWVMNAWQIVIYRYPRLFEEIRVSTWPYDFQSMYGYRNFTIRDSSGQLLAAANSIWINMDTLTHRPVRITEEDTRAYQLEERLDMDYAPRKITLPDTYIKAEPFLVVPSNIDTNNHVNNGQYIRMAENYLPVDFNIGQMRAEYRRSAVLGDSITPLIHVDDSVCTIILADGTDSPYAVVEFLKKGNTKC